MKQFFAFICLYLMVICGYAQPKLTDKDFNNLVALGELYTSNNMAKGDKFAQAADALRTPVLDHMIDALIATGKQDSTILENRFMTRPDNAELKLWYVLREIHYNRIDTSKKRLPNPDVARQVLARDIDERWLLDNYYFSINTGLAMFFNAGDLSHHNFDLDKLGFKNDTEKAIFFYGIMDALANGRFRVLQYLKKPDKLNELNLKMPQFNGKAYFYYTNLNIPDFEYMGYKETESYQKKQIDRFLNTLLIQFMNTASLGDKFHAREIYYNSILYKPEYFKYSALKDNLQMMFDKAKK
jgi:hypothetical protein